MNELLTKLTNKVNFEYAKRFDAKKERELLFVPINLQGEVFFVAVTSNTNKPLVSDYIKDTINAQAEFIFLTEQNFNDFFKEYQALVKEEYGRVDSPIKTKEKPGKIQANEESLLEDEETFSLDETVVEVLKPVNIENVMSPVLPVVEPPKIVAPDSNDVPGVVPRKVNIKAISHIKSPQTKKLGEILIEQNLLTEKQLTMALAESKVLDIPLGSVLVKLGFITIKDLKVALGAQQGLELATAEQLRALPSAISVFPEDFVKLNKVIPLSMSDKSLVVGMVNPGDAKVINEIVYQTGLKPTVMMITHYEFENFVQTYYQTERRETEKILRQIEKEDFAVRNDASLWDMVEREIQDTTGSVSKFANRIITYAIDSKASDIHIEPRLEGYVVRYRVDGILREVLKIPAKVDTSIISRFKVLARMNIAEHRRAQDGNFTIKYKKSQYDFRINTIPVSGKEKMVIRVLAPASSVKTSTEDDININGVSSEDVEKIKLLISSPNGIILTSGPTGSGKTTTLYSLINALNSESVNITTIEDPVEIKLDGVNQSSVNPKAGITFASSLRAILRQDPDIILVGEIRDYETLEVAISASLTGHLVLSTIHTNSCASTITRLIEMGAKDYLISSTIAGVMAQRLVRKLCPDCKKEYYPALQDAKKVLIDPVEIEEFMKTKIYEPVGCNSCDNTGYSGRLGVYEIMVINKEMRKLIAQRTHDVELEEYAVRNGMKTLRQACLDHIVKGVTTIDEYVRVLGLITD